MPLKYLLSLYLKMKQYRKESIKLNIRVGILHNYTFTECLHVKLTYTSDLAVYTDFQFLKPVQNFVAYLFSILRR